MPPCDDVDPAVNLGAQRRSNGLSVLPRIRLRDGRTSFSAPQRPRSAAALESRRSAEDPRRGAWPQVLQTPFSKVSRARATARSTAGLVRVDTFATILRSRIEDGMVDLEYGWLLQAREVDSCRFLSHLGGLRRPPLVSHGDSARYRHARYAQ